MPGAKIIEPGDTADIRFICKLKTGEVVAATGKAEIQGERLSRVLFPTDKDGPVSIMAVTPGPLARKERAFEDEINERLAGMVSGMKEGESRNIELTAQDLPERKPENYVTTIARVRIRPKEMRMPVGDYTFRAGKSPEVGQSFALDPSFPGRVESVTDKEVVIRFKADPGTEIVTPFGTGRILEDESNYKVDIDAVQGAIVRSGPFVGRIAGVDAESILLDYRNPLGGETLTCNVKVEKVSKEKPTVSAAGK
jgi:FKBP-type peptidyl-prolyl cis-trans isomerase 2